MTPRNEPPSKLETAVTTQGRTIELLGLRIEVMDQHLDRIAGNIEALTEQIGRLTEATFETQNLLRQSGDRRDAQIDRLLGILERLIPSPSVNN